MQKLHISLPLILKLILSQQQPEMKNNIANYRPIAKISNTSKLFERIVVNYHLLLLCYLQLIRIQFRHIL